MKIANRTCDLQQANFSDNINPLLQKVFHSRGCTSDADLQVQLSNLPRPDSLLGIEVAVKELVQVLKHQQSILIVGDFDADGATSVALMVLVLKAMGHSQVDYLVPNRFDYGYGLTPEIVELARGKSPDLIITVDNGISSIEGVDCANQLGIRVVITDHHLPGAQLPNAVAIVNPNQQDCSFPCKNLAGVAVAFYLLSALRAKLRELNWFVDQGVAEPNMANYLDLVALGTVADVVPLDQVNRALVHQGLLRIRAGQARPGIQALLKIAGKNSARLVAADLGFAVGPRLNAAGRLDDMSLGIQCLLTEDPAMAIQTAQQLEQLNQDRKAIERSMQVEAHEIVEKLGFDDCVNLPHAFCLYQADWHQGVVGLLASRIKEKYHRPTAVFARDKEGVLKGSIRSISGLHIRDLLDTIATLNPGLISKFGGHAMAAGLSLNESALPKFEQLLQQQVKRTVDESDLQATIMTDGELDADCLNMHTAQMLRDAAPWGQAFPEPCFQGLFTLVHQRIVGESHLKVVLSPTTAQQLTIDGIYFNVDTEKWPATEGLVHCVYRLDINEFRGQENLQLLILHMESCTT
jgi:single-stranded-DNA-specific exonuclease